MQRFYEVPNAGYEQDKPPAKIVIFKIDGRTVHIVQTLAGGKTTAVNVYHPDGVTVKEKRAHDETGVCVHSQSFDENGKPL